MELIKKDRQAKTFFLLTVTALIISGFIFIYSSSSIFALEKCGSAQFFVKKHAIGFVLGMICFIICRFFPLPLLKKLSPLCFIGSLVLMGLTFVPGIAMTIHGSSRWISLAGVSFQPSELLKVSFVLYIAFFLDKKKFQLSSFVHGYLPFLIIIAIAAGVLLLQPDFGQAVTLSVTAFILFFIIHSSMHYLLYTIIPLIPLVGVLVFLTPYRFNRILTFLNPWKDPQGAGFQIIQSLIAIGSGGVTGVGIAQSRQKFFYLPMQHTDFIFSIIAEETGFIGAVVLILLFISFLYWGIRLAWYRVHTFAQLTILGFVSLISLQTLINLCVATGLMPTKGIGLPFVSYGNSALIGHLCMIGIILACVEQDL